MPTQTPREINWSALSPRSRECVKRVVMRIAAGYTTPEILALLEGERDEIEHMPLPLRGLPFTKNTLALELRHLRAEIRGQGHPNT